MRNFAMLSNPQILNELKKQTTEILNVPDLGVCWIWQKARSKSSGYGRVWMNGKVRATHRVTFELVNGAIPEGLEPDHLCKIVSCCRPDHIEVVTHQVNCLRSGNAAAKNAQKTHCKNGHELTEDNVVQWRLEKHNRRECLICNRVYQRNHRKSTKEKQS